MFNVYIKENFSGLCVNILGSFYTFTSRQVYSILSNSGQKLNLDVRYVYSEYLDGRYVRFVIFLVDAYKRANLNDQRVLKPLNFTTPVSLHG